MIHTQDARPPRAAATLVVLRDSQAGPQVLLTTRPKHLRFMGGAVVFPGGATAAADADPRWEDRSATSGDEAARVLGEEDPRTALAAFVCALREAFEEVGFLLADGPVGELDRETADDPAAFVDGVVNAGIKLRTDLLVPAGRWVTPLGAPVRFDARFFLAVAPPEWIPAPDPREVEECWWSTPAEALTALAAGRLVMAPPTIEMLQRLDAHGSVAEIVDSLRRAPVGAAGDIISVRLSPLVHVVLAPNPGVMTGPGTNTYVVGTGPSCVIDPAVDDEAYLEKVLAAAGEVSTILVTHRHSDHVGGVGALAGRTGAQVRAWGDRPAGGEPVRPLSDEEEVVAGGVPLVALHTPGHAADHVSFHLPEAASLFAGDNVLGEGTAVIAPPDGNMGDYLATLHRLSRLAIDRIYPGHFRPLDGGRAVIEGYIEHRRRRADAVLAAVGGGAATVPEIVELVYRDTPAHLHPVAEFQVQAMLEMLRDEGEVTNAEERWSRRFVD